MNVSLALNKLYKIIPQDNDTNRHIWINAGTIKLYGWDTATVHGHKVED